MAGCCEQCDEPSGSIKCMKFLYWLRKIRTTRAVQSVAHTSTRVRPRNNQSFFQLTPVLLFSYHTDYSLDLPITIIPCKTPLLSHAISTVLLGLSVLFTSQCWQDGLFRLRKFFQRLPGRGSSYSPNGPPDQRYRTSVLCCR